MDTALVSIGVALRGGSVAVGTAVATSSTVVGDASIVRVAEGATVDSRAKTFFCVLDSSATASSLGSVGITEAASVGITSASAFASAGSVGSSETTSELSLFSTTIGSIAVATGLGLTSWLG